jgi:hypothetical protein
MVRTVLFFPSLIKPSNTHESILLLSFLMDKRGFQVSSIIEEFVAVAEHDISIKLRTGGFLG